MTVHNGRLKMLEEGISLSLEEFLDADETSNNVIFLSKISDTPDLSLCPEVIEPQTKPASVLQTLTVNDYERDFPTNPEPVLQRRTLIASESDFLQILNHHQTSTSVTNINS